MARECEHRRQQAFAWWAGNAWYTFSREVDGAPDRITCLDCNHWFPLGPAAAETPEVAVEKRAAEVAGDAREGVGLGGHRPQHCTGEHCWHWFEDDCSDNANQCCYCGHNGIVLPGIENDCQVARLVHAIANHDEEQNPKLTFRMFPHCTGVTQLAPTNRQCGKCKMYGQQCDARVIATHDEKEQT